MSETARSLTLSVANEAFAILKFAADETAPAWASQGNFFSITRTEDELSIVTQVANLPAGVGVERKWAMLKVGGVFAFTEVGVMASLARPLAEAGIGIFVISTFETDYLLVSRDDLAGATRALRAAGHTVLRGELTYKETKESGK
jgi:hypothetical protein